MSSCRRRTKLLQRAAQAALIGLGLAQSTARAAATYTWDAGGTDTSWSTAANWLAAGGSDNTVPPDGSDVVFGTGGTSAIIDTTSRTIGTLGFNRLGNFTLSASSASLTLNNGISAAAPTVSGRTYTIDNTVPLFLGASNVWNVDSTVGATTLSVAGVVADSTPFNLTKTGNGLLILGGANTYSGVTTISGGTLQISTLAVGGAASGIGDSGSLASNLVLDGGALRYSSVNSTTTDRLFTLGAGGGTLEVSGTTVSFSNGGAIAFTGSGARTLTLTGTGTSSLASTLSNSGSDVVSLTKEGTGLWALSGANTYSGATTISAGTLQLAGGSNRLPTGTAVSIASGGTLDLNSISQTIASLSGVSGAGINLGSGTLTVGDSNNLTFGGVIGGAGGSLVKQGTGRLTLGSNSYTGSTFVQAGTLQLTGGNNRLSPSSTLILSGGTFELNGSITQTVAGMSGGGGTIQLGSGTLTDNPASGSATYSGIMTGAGNFTKSGNGSLTLSGSSNYTGTTTVTAGNLLLGGTDVLPTSGTLSLTGGTFLLNGRNQTLGTLSSSVSTATINLGGNTLTFNNTSGLFSAFITGTGGNLVKTGAGIGSFHGSNNFTGSVLIGGGTLALDDLQGTASNIGGDSVPLTIDGGYLRWIGTVQENLVRSWSFGSNAGGFDATPPVNGATLTISGTFNETGSGNRTLNLTGTNTGANTVSSTLVDPSGGSLSIAKSGTGTWVLSGANTYTGATTINGGVLSVSNLANGSIASNIGKSSKAGSNLVLNGGTLRYTGGTITIDRHFSIGTQSGSASVVTFDASGTGPLSISDWWVVENLPGQDGVRTVTLGGTNTGNNTFGIRLTDYDFGVPGGGATDASTGSGGNFGAPTSLIKIGSGKWVLPATVANEPGGVRFNNWYTGSTQILGGTLEVQAQTISGLLGGGLSVGGDASAIGKSTNAAGNLVLDGGTLRYVYNGGGTITQAGHDAGQIDRLFTLGVGGGTIDTSGDGPLNFFNPAAISYSGVGARTLTLTGNFVDPTDGTQQYSGLGVVISDNGGATSLVKDGTGEWVLTGSNTYTGSTTINNGILLIAHGNNRVPAVTNMTLGSTGEFEIFTGDSVHAFELISQTVSTLSGSGTITLNAGRLIINGSGNSSFSGVIRDHNNDGSYTNQTGGGITKSGNGIATLSGANTYTGQTLITAGTLMLAGGANRLPTATALQLDGGTLNLNGFDQTVASLSGTATVSLGNPGGDTFTVDGSTNTTFSGIINGIGNFVKQGTSGLTLSNAQGYTGTTTINAGTLLLTGGNNRLPGNAMTINGGTLDINNLSQSIGALTGIGGTINLGNTSTGLLSIAPLAGSYNYSGVITGAGSLTKAGSSQSSQTLSGINTYTGTTSISSGTLIVGVDNALPTAGTISLTGGTLNINGKSQTIGVLAGTANINLGGGTLTLSSTVGAFSGPISGTGGQIVKLGSGAATFSGANVYTGQTTVSVGTLLLSNAGTNNISSSAKILVNAGANLNVTNLAGGGLTLAPSQTLASDGTVWGAVTATAASTTISTGNSPAQSTFAGAGNLTLNNNATVQLSLGSPTPGTGYDQIVITNAGAKTLTLGGAKLKLLPIAGIATGTPYTIVSNTATTPTISGVFSNLDNSSLNQGGPYAQGDLTFTIDYDNTFVKVTFTTVPEPSSVTMLTLLGSSGALLQRRRRGRRQHRVG